MSNKCLVTTIVLSLFVLPPVAKAVTPAESFDRGKARLAEGDLRGALKEYAEAVRAAPDSDSYRQEFMLVRNAVLLKQNLTRSAHEKQWVQTAQALRSFYVTNGLLELALELDNQIHAKRDTAYSAMQLAETRLVLDRNADAEEVLLKLGPDRSTPASQALLAVAQARQGRMDEARRIVKAAASPDEKGPGTLYNFARMHAAVGNTDESLSLLTSSFESTPPSTLELFKRHARKCPEFASMAESPGFQQALKTESKVHESECSSGSSCASCPMRGQCSSGESQ